VFLSLFKALSCWRGLGEENKLSCFKVGVVLFPFIPAFSLWRRG